MRLHHLLAAGLFLFASAGPVTPAHAQRPAVERFTKEFVSGGQKIRVEHFAQHGEKKRPVIILAPESASFKKVGPVYRCIAESLAEEGYLVLIVHFFDRTGHDGIAKKDIDEKLFRKWMEALGDGITYARGLANAEKGHVGLLGFSLGGYLSVAVAADPRTRVQAVGCYFGGVPAQIWPVLRTLPPVLVVHGTRDKVVPVSEAYALVGFCRANDVTCVCKIFQAEGHLFEKSLTNFVAARFFANWVMGRSLDPSEAIAQSIRQEPTVREAVRLGVEFFKAHLR
jgi:dienelactone hydrolase